MPSESQIITGIVRAAKRHGWYVVRMRGGEMRRAGVPAVLCLKDGKAVWFNAPRPGSGKKSEPTPSQANQMVAIQLNGGCHVFAAFGEDDADKAFRWLNVKNNVRTTTDPQAARCERRSVCR